MTDVYKSLKKGNLELKKQLELARKDLKSLEERLEIQEKNSASNGVAPVAVELAREAEKTLSFLGQITKSKGLKQVQRKNLPN